MTAAADSDPYVVITADTHAGASVQTYKEYLDPKYVPIFEEWRSGYKNPQKKHIGSKKHKNWRLRSLWTKYPDEFRWKILSKHDTEEQARAAEQILIDFTNPDDLYNIDKQVYNYKRK